jgi:hypothetical protein
MANNAVINFIISSSQELFFKIKKYFINPAMIGKPKIKLGFPLARKDIEKHKVFLTLPRRQGRVPHQKSYFISC